MDETNVNGIEAEETEALIPEGWDGEGDFFDDASWTDTAETSEEPTPVEEDSEPEVSPTTAEEEPAEEPAQEVLAEEPTQKESAEEPVQEDPVEELA